MNERPLGAVPAHAPPTYDCPFCHLVSGGGGELNRQDDVVYRGSGTTAFVSPKWWASNPGHLLVVPDEHHENLYGIPPDLLGAV